MTDTLIRPVVSADRAPEILAAAEIVMERFGYAKLSLAEISRVSLIPLARIYQFFADRNAVLGALSSRALQRISGLVDTRGSWSPELTERQRLERVVERLAGSVTEPSCAYLVLCAPFDPASEQARQDAVRRVAKALRHALEPAAEATTHRSDDALEYAAELIFACLRRSYLAGDRVSTTSIEMAQHAVTSFVTTD